ncbi:MAG: carbohydrate-binding domain-containing protein [Ruminococcaceae bacterium]|nr:carbohydrate-binding domain-containing protein [Oscillospiraceae bacterium]
MISSKKFDLIAIVLTALVLVGIICAMFLPKDMLTGNTTGVFNYGDLHTVTIAGDDYYTDYAKSSPVKINLMGDYIEASSNNIKIDGSDITILGGGVYVLSGTLNDGTVIVDSEDGAEVRLILNGVNIISSDFSAMDIRQSAKTVISLAEGTENVLTDGSVYNEEKLGEETAAAISSKDDLVINGNGSLSVNANSSDGIKANDSLKITGGSIKITSVDDGVNANDYIAALNTSMTINSGGDAIKCEHTEEEKGFITFEESVLSVTSGGDGVYASSALYMNETKADIVSGGGNENAVIKRGGFGGFGRFGANNSSAADDTPSTKAIKAGTNIVINGGSFNLDSAEDAIHSDKDAAINKGTFEILSGDDAVHAELNLVLEPETLNISKSYEGLEGAYITINGGDIRIVSNDDGINASGENSNGGMMMPHGMRGGEEKTAEEDIWLTVNDGHIHIETSGDGFDSNGSAVINGGFLEIYGPENSGNGSIDVGDGGYVLIMNGGSLLAAGSSGMAEHPTENSPQQSLTFYLDEINESGSTIRITDSAGNEIISGTSNKRFNWICISTESLTEGEIYTLFINETETARITANGGFSSTGTRSGGFGGFGGERPEGNFGRRQKQ